MIGAVIGRNIARTCLLAGGTFMMESPGDAMALAQQVSQPASITSGAKRAKARNTVLAARTRPDTDDTVRPALPATHQGNLLHPSGGSAPGYWSGLEGHISAEAGIAGNPWTRSARNLGQFYTDRANTVTLNQIIGSISHPVTSIGAGYGLGFVAEIMYGSDARFDPTLGMADKALSGLYQVAPTQAHIDLHTPWIVPRGIDFKFGQIYGLMGAEGTPATSRPFYTFDYASNLLVPFQTVGIVSTTHLASHLDWILGIDAGNSTTFGGAGNNSRPKGYIGFSFDHLLRGKLDGHVIGHFGPQGNNGPTTVSPAGWTSAGIGKAADHKMFYNGDILLTYHIRETVSATLDATYLHDEITRDDTYGVTGYLAWKISSSLDLNLRGEVFRDNTGTMVTAYVSTTSYGNMLRNAPYPHYGTLPTTYGALTAGVTYTPQIVNRHLGHGRFMLRPEIRLDRSLNGTSPFNRAATVEDPVVRDGTSDMLLFSCDAIWTF